MEKINYIKDTKDNKKYVFRLDDSYLIEAAVFSHNDGFHLCVPSQVGCAMKCRHCATTYVEPSFLRQLKYDEMVEMIYYLLQEVGKNKQSLTLSFSGHGEPMCNWQCVAAAIEHFKEIFDVIDVTSVGIRSTMKQILLENVIPNLFFSIHGSDDRERTRIVNPCDNMNVAFLEEIIEFCESYVLKKGGRCVWNYMLCNENMTKNSIMRLLEMVNNIDFPLELRFTKYVNICRDNGIREIPDDIVEKVLKEVKRKIRGNITVRYSHLEGIETQIACGQMRARNK